MKFTIIFAISASFFLFSVSAAPHNYKLDPKSPYYVKLRTKAGQALFDKITDTLGELDEIYNKCIPQEIILPGNGFKDFRYTHWATKQRPALAEEYRKKLQFVVGTFGSVKKEPKTELSSADLADRSFIKSYLEAYFRAGPEKWTDLLHYDYDLYWKFTRDEMVRIGQLIHQYSNAKRRKDGAAQQELLQQEPGLIDQTELYEITMETDALAGNEATLRGIKSWDWAKCNPKDRFEQREQFFKLIDQIAIAAAKLQARKVKLNAEIQGYVAEQEEEEEDGEEEAGEAEEAEELVEEEQAKEDEQRIQNEEAEAETPIEEPQEEQVEADIREEQQPEEQQSDTREHDENIGDDEEDGDEGERVFEDH